MPRISSGSYVPANPPSSSSKPQSTDQPDAQSPPPSSNNPPPSPSSDSSGGQQSDGGQNAPSPPITGGVDSRTQFLATQNMRSKRADSQGGSSDPGATQGGPNTPGSQDGSGGPGATGNNSDPGTKISTADINKAAGGDQDIENLLTKLDTDTEGHKELQLALNQGTTYQKGSVPGGQPGMITTNGGHPVVILNSDGNSGLNIDTVANETGRIAYPGMSPTDLNSLGQGIQTRVNNGQTGDNSQDPTNPPSPSPQGTDGSSSGNDGSTGGPGNTGGGSSGGNSGSAGGAGNNGGDSFNGGGGSSGGRGGSSGGGSVGGTSGGGGGGGGGPTNNTGVNTTIAALPPAGNITDAQLSQIANGDPKVIAALKLMLKDPDGAKLVQMVIQKHGHIVDDESESGGQVGEAPVGGDNPTIKIKESALNSTGSIAQTLFHEFTHVSGDPGDANHNSGNDGHDSVYNAQKAFCQRMGIPFEG